MAANNILKIKRTKVPHRLKNLDPWRYKDKTIWDLRVKKDKKKKKRNA